MVVVHSIASPCSDVVVCFVFWVWLCWFVSVAQQPVSVAIYSSDPGFSTYTGGIWYDSGCEDVTANMLDHAVLVVGYGSEKNEDYWIVKNSWAPKWGEDGYIRMRRNVKSATGLCGIAIDASFPNMD